MIYIKKQTFFTFTDQLDISVIKLEDKALKELDLPSVTKINFILLFSHDCIHICISGESQFS